MFQATALLALDAVSGADGDVDQLEMPYSFFFREFRGGRAGICGGLILHNQDDIFKAYYNIHT